jgi:predicted NAD/FAD-binding protein
MQDGKSVCPPKKGPVEMTYTSIIVHPFYKKGNYAAHVQMWATDGSRITDFEGTVWVNGGIDGDDGWLSVDGDAGEKP